MTRALALLLLVATADAGTLRATHLDPGHAENDFFGYAIATDGGTLLAGARFTDVATTADAGVAYLIDPSFGVVRQTLVAPAPGVGDRLGSAVAFLGGSFLVGAPHRDSGAPHAGAVLLFDPPRTFTKPTPAFDDLFGAAVVALGANVLVGAPSDSTAAESAGAAYLLDGRSGALLRTFQAPKPAPADLFGATVAAAGSRAVIGAPFDDTAKPNAGAVYLFDATSGALLQTLTSPHPQPGDFFGSALAASGTAVLVGAPYVGAVHLFDAASGALLRSFLDPVTSTDDRFGAAVALVGGAVLVGAPFDDTDGQDAGIAYLFDAATGALLATYHNPTPAAGDQFGSAVAAAGNLILVSAWLDDTAAPNAGAVYVFTEDVLPPIPTTTTLTTTTTLAFDTTTTTTTDPGATTTTSATSTTGTSASATTTTATATPAPGAPSTTLAPSVACSVDSPVCDDKNPCTTDRCSDGGCVHVDATGLDAVVCRLDALDAVLHELPPRALGGRATTSAFELRVATARHLVDRSRTPSRRSTARLRRARSVLGRLQARVQRGMRRGRIARIAGGNVVALAADAATRL